MGAVRRLDGDEPGCRPEQAKRRHHVPFSRPRSSSRHGSGDARNVGAVPGAHRRTAARRGSRSRCRRAGRGRRHRTATLPADPAAKAGRRSTVRDRISRPGRRGFRVHVRLIVAASIKLWRPGMDELDSREKIDHHRRRFIGAAAISIVAAKSRMIGSAAAQRSETNLPAAKPGTNTSFAALKQIEAGLLNVGYAEAGPADGAAVILLHGWPYDIHSYVDVAPLLAEAGYRAIVPYLRGYGREKAYGKAPRNWAKNVTLIS